MYCFARARAVPFVTQDKLLFSPHTPLTDWPLLWKQILKHLHELLRMEYILHEQQNGIEILGFEILAAGNQYETGEKISCFACCLLRAGFCLASSEILKMELTFSPKCRLMLNGLRGFISQKTELFSI
jgi:hypothetical protein